MSNMSYCRFENTLRNMRDCLANVNEGLSQSEAEAAMSLLRLCKDYVEAMGETTIEDLMESDEDEDEEDPENIYNLPGIRQSIEEDRK